MNCQKFEEVVSELARDQMMEADVRVKAEAHASECDNCAERLAVEESLSRALRALSREMLSVQPPKSLELQLRHAFREQQKSPPPAVISRPSRRYWVVAAAAVLLLALGVVAIRFRQTQPGGTGNVLANKPEENKPSRLANVPSAEPKPTHDAHDRRNLRPIRKHVNVAANTARRRNTQDVASNHAREIATEFIPISYSNGATLQDGGQIVRVELPRSALVRFGLPVNMDRLNEKVKADVWVGVDGLAHAIRFVQ